MKWTLVLSMAALVMLAGSEPIGGAQSKPGQPPVGTTGSAPKSTAGQPAGDLPWPRVLKQGTMTISMYQPQLDAWDGLKLTGQAAVSVKEDSVKEGSKDAPTYGVVSLSARTLVDKGSRMVTLDQLKVTAVKFPSAPEKAASYGAAVGKAVETKVKRIGLERLEAELAIEGARERSAAVPVKNDPPQIIFSQVPAILVYVDGTPKYQKVKNTSLQRVINTRPLIVRDEYGKHFIHVFDGWLEADKFDGRYQVSKSKSQGLEAARQDAIASGVVDLLEGTGETDQGQTTRPSLAKGPVPVIYVATRPTELIVTDGAPNYLPVPTTDLLYVTNTTGHIFRQTQDQQIYVLLAGRWFRGPSIQGPWTWVANDKLPGDFAKIPDDSPKENVKASVAGTPQAREALIENSIPETAAVKVDSARMTPPKFDGDPELKAIEGTKLQYVVNTATPIIMVSTNQYFALENGVWFVGPSVTGPWHAATTVPAAIYEIPPSSPLYYVTYVRVYQADKPDTVYVAAEPGYYGSCVSHGAVVYGTGYPYTPWVGSVWYGPPVTYGFGVSMRYNPWSGWTFGFGFGWAWGGATVAVGWGWGAYPWWGPVGWGGYYPYPYYRPAYWGAGGYGVVGPYGAAARGAYGGWAATTGNVYSRWGSTSAVTRTSTGYNPWTGNARSRQVGTAYNSRTGVASAGQRGSVQNVYTGSYASGARGVATGPGGASVAGTRGTVGNTRTGQEVTAGRVTGADPNTGRAGSAGYVSGERGTVGRVGNDFYAGKDGNVYRQGSGGQWEQAGQGGNWNRVNDANRTTSLESSQRARTQGAQRQSNVNRSMGGARRGGGRGR